MRKYMFDSYHQWWVCLCAGFRRLLWGLWRVVTCFILGIISILWYCILQIEAFCKRETIASFIVGITTLTLAIGWMTTYVNNSVKLRIALNQRDSVSIKLEHYLQAYESGKTLVVNGDTIRK